MFGEISLDRFFDEFWQRRPLLVRGAMREHLPALEAQTLADLACDEEAESRIVRGPDQGRWDVRYGPFDEEDFRQLPGERWTLLVQEVDRLVPPVARLLEVFDFLPGWRLDDVMVSYAVDGGSVGPHVDNYDVFLIQGHGRRRWEIGDRPVLSETLLPGVDLSVLAEFEPAESWVVDPGDMLYLPPRFAHHGVAVGECMTFSVGCRAPSELELVVGFTTRIAEQIAAQPDARYADADLGPSADPGRIEPPALKRLREMVRGALTSASTDEQLDAWLGAFLTEPRREAAEVAPERPLAPAELVAALRSGASLRRSSYSRFAYLLDRDGAPHVFVGGEQYELGRELAGAAEVAAILCGRGLLDATTLERWLDEPLVLELLTDAHDRGFLQLQVAPGSPAK